MMPGPRAGSGVGKYNAESPTQGSKRFNFITKTSHFAHLGILYLSMQYTMHTHLTERCVPSLLGSLLCWRLQEEIFQLSLKNFLTIYGY